MLHRRRRLAHSEESNHAFVNLVPVEHAQILQDLVGSLADVIDCGIFGGQVFWLGFWLWFNDLRNRFWLRFWLWFRGLRNRLRFWLRVGFWFRSGHCLVCKPLFQELSLEHFVGNHLDSRIFQFTFYHSCFRFFNHDGWVFEDCRRDRFYFCFSDNGWRSLQNCGASSIRFFLLLVLLLFLLGPQFGRRCHLSAGSDLWTKSR
mmetsp:Transcript_18639/g.38390  ORF Transcript_18639/g.38390 Transcript_18639/m.38390 type:complete len:203 (+) Transcript_18639:113-721(+)